MTEYLRKLETERVDRDVEIFRQGWRELHQALKTGQEWEREVEAFSNSQIEGKELAKESLGYLERVASEKLEMLQIEQPYMLHPNIRRFFKLIETSEPLEIGYGLDFNLELRSRDRIVTEATYPSLFRLFVAIPGDKDGGLEKENHGYGYHLHYVSIRNGRTDVVFTFHPAEALTKDGSDKLYWYHHGSGKVNSNPDRFAQRRRESIHSRSIQFLLKISKSDFVSPRNRKSQVLYP